MEPKNVRDGIENLVAARSPSRRRRLHDPGFSSWSDLAERFVWNPVEAAFEVAVLAGVLVTLAVGAFSSKAAQIGSSRASYRVASADIPPERSSTPSEMARRGCATVNPLAYELYERRS
jgi:hypothetical protein